MHYNFQWDPKKDQANRKKHGISFREATQVFRDPVAMTLFDDEHSHAEERWITMGQIPQSQTVVVVHTFVEQSDNIAIIRIISARHATQHEVQQYEGS